MSGLTEKASEKDSHKRVTRQRPLLKMPGSRNQLWGPLPRNCPGDIQGTCRACERERAPSNDLVTRFEAFARTECTSSVLYYDTIYRYCTGTVYKFKFLVRETCGGHPREIQRGELGAAALAKRNHTRICDLAAPTEIQTGELGAAALTKRNNNLPCNALFLYIQVYEPTSNAF